jgi:hypothetical protein
MKKKRKAISGSIMFDPFIFIFTEKNESKKAKKKDL